ncbi:hypothetical protein C8R44DRAFT_643164 [Mycena epipterygia]|nr:hypothetical protein C8R44DRAFT_643164 [Mycena epipterygia]
MLSGPAGSGKSTIAKSVASILAEEHHILAASFFFSRDYAERKELKHLPSTLARQLADHDSDFQRLLVKFVDGDRTGILFAEPWLQFQKLVVEILAELPPSTTPWVICLDALDECGKDRGQVLLRWISDSIVHIPPHIRFFLTGRPDVPSYLKFDRLLPLTHAMMLDDIDSITVKHDIHLYVERSLDGNNWTTRDPWKAHAHDVDEIVNRAGGLFIFAATAVRYVLSGLPQEPPQRSIDYLLSGAPLTHLHDLYRRIVNEAITVPTAEDHRALGYRDRAIRALGAILHMVEPQSSHILAALLEIHVDELRRTLLPLSAVIQVPDSPGEAIRIIHISFREFMISKVQDTRDDLLCGTEDQRRLVTYDLLRVMHTELRFNICHLPTSYLRNVDMPNLNWRLETYIPGHLRYACRFWMDHLATTSYDADTARAAEKLLYEQFLFWLEALSLLGMVAYAPRALSKIIAWAPQDPAIVRFATDAKRFISFFADAIIKSAPHIYLSALALAPAQSEITKRFRPRFPRLAFIERAQLINWPATMAVLEGHTEQVNSVAFSPDGKRIVSGSSDTTLRLWDVETGEGVGQPLIGHTDFVNSVMFSPDGRQIVSGSGDATVRLWDAESGEPLGVPFIGHTNAVTSVAFSSDGKQIVSGSEDRTIRI